MYFIDAIDMHDPLSTKMIGYAATFIGIISFFPILYKITQTKNTDNFTYNNLLLALLSNILWMVYGAKKSAMAPLVSGILYLMVYGFIMIYKMMF